MKNNKTYKVLIIEDEPPAAKTLVRFLQKEETSYEVIDIIDSVDASINFLKSYKGVDLIFMDVQLSDGLSFEIFTKVDVHTPVIFTTAFDNYMLNAFKVHSVDYLLKPIEPEEFKNALSKFIKFYQSEQGPQPDFKSMLNQFLEPTYKQRFLIKSGSEIKYLQTSDIAYFYSEEGYTHVATCENRKHIIDYKLDELQGLLDPKVYFRINRKLIVHIEAIKKIESYFNGRYKLTIDPRFNDEVIVSRERSSHFKAWLDQ